MPGKTINAKVGDTVTLNGTSNRVSNKLYCGYSYQWEPAADNENGATITKNGKTASVTFDRPGTYEFTHYYCNSSHFFSGHSPATETFKVVVSDNVVTSLTITGESSVNQFETTQLTGNASDVTWTSSDSSIATIDASGKVTGVAEGKVTITATAITAEGKVLTATHDVTVTKSTAQTNSAKLFFLKSPTNNPDSNSAGDWFPTGGSSDLNVKVNVDGAAFSGINTWDNVANRVVSWPDGSTGATWTLPRANSYWSQVFNNYKKEIQNNLGVSITEDDVEAIILHPYKISNNSGVYHLDCKIEIKVKQVVTATFWIQSPGATGFDKQYSVSTLEVKDGVAQVVAPEAPEAEKTVNDTKYKFMGWYSDQACTQQVTFPVTTSENVFYWGKYVPCDQSIQVNYYLEGTTTPVAPSKTLTGYMKGQTVTQEPIAITGYTPVSSEAKTGVVGTDASIDFYYTANTVNYKVEYYWNGSDDPFETDNASGKYGDTISASPKSFSGYTAVSNDAKSLTLSDDENKNIVKFYYYKNVTLTANSGTKAYNGQEQSVDGYTTNLPEGTTASFDGVTLNGGKGTNAGDYAYTFADGTVGKVSTDNNYIVTELNPGNLHISPVNDEVTVTITGHKGGEKYNGEEQTVEGYDVSGLPSGASEGDIAFTGSAEVKATDAGTYPMNLNEKQFSLSGDAAKNYTNVKFKVTDGELNIGKRQVTLESEDGHKNYDGKTLQRRTNLKVGGDGFVGNDGVLAKDKLTWYDENNILPGTYENKFEPAYTEGTNLDNYEVTLKFGELVVNARSDKDKYQITVTAKSDTKPYDGNGHSVSGVAGATFTNDKGATFTVEGLSASVSATDAGEYTNKVTGTAVVKDAQGNDVTSQFKVTTVDGTLTINKRDVTIKPKDATKDYDGKKLVATDWEVAEGSLDFVKGQGIAKPTYTGSQTKPGTSESGISSWGYKDNTKASNYNIKTANGTLTVTSRGASQTITVEANSTDATYNGAEHSAKGLKSTTFTVDGETYTVSGLTTEDPAETNAGTYTNNITGIAKVTDADGNDVTSEFKVETKNGTLKIDRAEVTIAPKDASKPYDGTPLVASDFTATGFVGNDGVTNVVYGGSQTVAGESASSIVSYEPAEGTNLNNYDITKGTGTLTVTATDAAVVVKIKGNTDSKKYSGSEQSVSGYTVAGVTVDGKDSDLYGAAAGTDFAFNGNATATRTDAGTTDMGLATDRFNNINKNFSNVTFEVEDGSMTITKREVTLTSATDDKPYDGTPLTKPDVTVAGDGFVEGEVSNIRATGSVTTVAEGEVTNAIEFDKSEAFKSGNYDIAKNEGKLSITELSAENGLTIKPNSVDYTYDATRHAAAAATAKASVSGTKVYLEYRVKGTTDDNWTSDPATITAVNAGVTAIEVRASADNYSGYKYAEQTLTINKRTVELKSAGATKVYDGTPLVKDQVTVSREGFIKSDLAEDVHAIGTQTKVGASDNTISYKLKEGVANNYNILPEKLGTLTVTAQSIVPDPEKPDGYKGVTISDPSSSVYNGEVHKWVPEVKDAKGVALTEGTDYTVSYDTDNFIDAKKITVTIAGTGNYCGSVTKTYRITKAPLTVNAKSASKVYDGSPLTAGGTIKGLVGDETATVKTEGSQTEVGSSDNKFVEIEWDGTAKEGNYYIQSQNDGVLTVTAKGVAALEVGTLSDVVYSGVDQAQKPEVKDGVKTLKEGTDYKVSFSNDVKNVGTVTVTVTGKGNYAGTVTRTYEITKRSVKLTGVKNVTKVYDGTALEAKDVTVTGDGFVGGEVTDIKATGSVTEVTAKPVENPIEFTAGKGFKEGNYTIEKDPGTLQVTARSIDDTTYGMSVSKPESVEYDGQAHKWAPTVKDGEKTLAEGTDYTVAYGKDDFTNVTGEIKVTVTGKGNYAGSVERTYQITPAPLEVETEGATKVYDGEALTHDVATIKGLKNNETATIHATGSQTEVGESDNGYAITWDGSAQQGNYTVKTATIGKLVVSETADQITAMPVNVETTYDGSAHGTTVQVTGLPKGYTVKKAESKATATNVADGEVKAAVDELVIVNAQGKDVTSKLNIKRGTATIKINPAPLTVTTDGGEKEYDGTALTANGIKVEGLKGKDSVSAKTTGSRTKVGSSNNTYEINWKDTKKSNYKVSDVLGTLKVTPSTKAVTLTSGSASHAYSGHALTSDKIKAEGLPEGFTVKAKMDGAQTDAGSSKNTVKSYKILDAKGDDVTDMFANVTVKTGTLTVSPKKITVETEGATKVYDGQELTNKNGAIHGLVSGEHADVVTNGTQTNVGSSDNGYTIAWGTAKEGNYTIASDTLGKLVVTPQSVNPNDPSYRKLQVSNPADLTYDGQTHKWAPEVKDYTGTELKEGVDYTFAYNTDDFINAGSITVTVVGKGNYTGTVSRTYRIKPAPVSIKTESAARVYNGKALTAGGAITGLVNGETVDFRVTGSQTKVGHSANTYKLAWTGTAREANYAIASIETGTLTVTESEDTVVVTTTGGIFTYDGKAHGATVAVSQLPEGYTVDGTPSSDATATDVNGDGVKATVDHLVIRNAEGEDVTSKLNIKKVDGTIKVLPAELTVTTDSATKVYDGTALTAGATPTGLVGDEEVTLEATGKQTQVGSSSNGYKLTFDKTAKAKNYKVVSENLGTLTVTKQSIVPSEPGTPSDNYRGVTVDDPKDAVYDGVEHKWTPVVKDAEGKALIEDTDYVVSYDTDDFIDVATINVTITGKGNYTGTIVKSYRITKAPLHVVTGSATKFYDGTALTSATFTIDGLAERDRIGIAVTGSQTNVGSSQNTYAIDWMQTSADNYELTDELGTLTVAAAPARPTTPSTPTTPATPTVPNPTPNSSDGGSTATTSAPTGEDSAAGNDQEQKEEKIFDAKNPLGKFDGKKDTCWVHWYMIICAVATAAYGLFVGLRRDKHSRRLQNDLDEVLGNDDETQE